MHFSFVFLIGSRVGRLVGWGFLLFVFNYVLIPDIPCIVF